MRLKCFTIGVVLIFSSCKGRDYIDLTVRFSTPIAIAIDPNSERLIIGSANLERDGELLGVYDIRTGEQQQILLRRNQKFLNVIKSVAVSSNGIVALGSNYGSIHLFSLTKPEKNLPSIEFGDSDVEIAELDFDSTGTRLAVAINTSLDKPASLKVSGLRVLTSSDLRPLQTHQAVVCKTSKRASGATSVCYSSCEDFLVAAFHSCVELQKGGKLLEFTGHTNIAASMAVGMLAVSSVFGDSVEFYDLGGEPLASAKLTFKEPIGKVRFLSNGILAIQLGLSDIQFWDVRKKTLVYHLKASDRPIRNFLISSNDKFLVTLAPTGVIRIWNLSNFL